MPKALLVSNSENVKTPVRALVVEPVPTIGANPEVVAADRGLRRRRCQWAVLWAGILHAMIVLICSWTYLAPLFVPQIGTALEVSTEPATDFQEDDLEEPEEEIVISSQSAPPPKPVEAAIPELVPLATLPDIPLPEPNETPENQEIEPEIADEGLVFGEGFEIEPEPEEEPMITKIFSAPAKGIARSLSLMCPRACRASLDRQALRR